MNEILLNSIIEKVNAQETTIKEMQEAVQKVSGHPDEIEILQKEVMRLGTILKDVTFPVNEIKNLSEKITGLHAQLKLPVETKVQNFHHNHFPKIIWFTIILIMFLAVVSVGWYNTAVKLKQYRINMF
jgi:hypothetical protein